jgi:RNase P/RNase MRP subunit POP5
MEDKQNKKLINKGFSLKKLKKSMKEKKRYLFLKTNKNFSLENSLKRDIENSILDFSGIIGFSKTCLRWIKIKNDYAIISINRESLELVKACFCVSPLEIEVLGISGTLKGLNKYKEYTQKFKKSF